MKIITVKATVIFLDKVFAPHIRTIVGTGQSYKEALDFIKEVIEDTEDYHGWQFDDMATEIQSVRTDSNGSNIS